MRRTQRHAAAIALIAVMMGLAGCSPENGDGDAKGTSAGTTAGFSSTTPSAATRTATASSPAGRSTSAPASAQLPKSRPPHASALPLRLPTGDAKQVITVTAPSPASTTATLRAWTRVSGGWRPSGPEVLAQLGADGIGQASEQSTRTPAGSYTLTQAFGSNANPGTSLPYVRTTPADWWISQPGPLYNTRQRCSSGCAFTPGAPNEPLYATVPFYRYAVVIDYNTPNAPGGVRAGAGSAFFLHVSVGEPTQGCVAIAQDQLVRLLRWLAPARHPRILLGVG